MLDLQLFGTKFEPSIQTRAPVLISDNSFMAQTIEYLALGYYTTARAVAAEKVL